MARRVAWLTTSALVGMALVMPRAAVAQTAEPATTSPSSGAVQAAIYLMSVLHATLWLRCTFQPEERLRPILADGARPVSLLVVAGQRYAPS
ncbi:MAG: hypothetical protein EOO77_11865 [Oxalobacteraceae bacterium]|nr:MAG: hypothetical protein EOO77_11865 [Oxalobacteraceae bacterium]